MVNKNLEELSGKQKSLFEKGAYLKLESKQWPDFY